jgi:hypothetical protein
VGGGKRDRSVLCAPANPLIDVTPQAHRNSSQSRGKKQACDNRYRELVRAVVSKNNVVTSLANEVLPERICRIRSRVYVAAQDGVIGAIDLHSMRKLSEIKLPGHPEAFAIEAGGHCLFVNVPKTHSVFVIALPRKDQFRSRDKEDCR